MGKKKDDVQGTHDDQQDLPLTGEQSEGTDKPMGAEDSKSPELGDVIGGLAPPGSASTEPAASAPEADKPNVTHMAADEPPDAMMQFNIDDLIKASNPIDIHKVTSGRVYRTVAVSEDGQSRLMMAASLEPYKQAVQKPEQKGFWRTVSLTVRFVVKGPDVYSTLKTRETGDAMDGTVTYKDKIAFPFCLDGNPVYISRSYKEREVEKFVTAELTKRVPFADKSIIAGILDAVFINLTTDDPVKLEAVG